MELGLSGRSVLVTAVSRGIRRVAVRLTNLVLLDMQASAWGRIVNVFSYSVKQPIENMMSSNSLRLGALGWAKTLAADVAAQGRGVLVNTVCPGWTDTERFSDLMQRQARDLGASVGSLRKRIDAQIPLGRIASAREIANVVVFLASEVASYLTGTAIAVDGGIVKAL